MESPHTWFADAFRSLLYERLLSAGGAYERFRVRYPSLDKEIYEVGDMLFDTWELQLPTHQWRQLELRSKDVRTGYVSFLLMEFDVWFVQQIASGTSP